jgi:cob(I)alamin adenosyltransferase
MTMTRSQGLVQIYTGDGKGKTTAALGLGLRAAGHGMKVIMVQFMKTARYYGELQAVKKLAPNFDIVQKGKPCTSPDADCVDCRECFFYPEEPTQTDFDVARDALEFSADVICKGEHDIVILDEILYAAKFGLVKSSDVAGLINTKPPNLELVLTGGEVPPELIELADLVTEMREVKHPLQQGQEARKGIEY